MGWETASTFHGEPTREDELNMIESLKQNLREQSYFSLIQNETYRHTSEEYLKTTTRRAERSYYSNYIRGIIFGALIFYPLSNFLLHKNVAGVPTHFVPKVYFTPLMEHAHFYRRWKAFLLWGPLTYLFAKAYATRRTSTAAFQDEFFTKNIHKLPYKT